MDCEFSGEVAQGPQYGNAKFIALEETHQKHSESFSCSSVLEMEKKYGRHNESCSHVGYWSATKCGCNK